MTGRPDMKPVRMDALVPAGALGERGDERHWPWHS